MREKDLVSRYGGDEFLIGLIDVTREEATIIAQDIIHSLSHPMRIHSFEMIITPSLGISTFSTEQVETVESLIKQADMAMYEAKKSARNPAARSTPQQVVLNESRSHC